VKLIVGLGNPGKQYQQSRHNVGFQVVDRLAGISHIPISAKRFRTLLGTGTIDSQEVILAKPMTFMNQSGEAVRKAAFFFHTEMEDLIVIHDDMDLPLGRLRFRRRGGDGGHQGVRSIIDSMGGGDFIRLKVGIGRPSKGVDPAEHVLASFDEMERAQLDETLSRAAEGLVVLLTEGIEAAMNRYQRRGGTKS